MEIKFKGKKIEIEIDYNGASCDPVDGYVSTAVEIDTGRFLSDDECEVLTNQFPEVIAEDALERSIDAGDALLDAYKEGF